MDVTETSKGVRKMMDGKESENTMAIAVEDLLAFQFPRYDELPNMGLYLEQALEIINGTLRPILPEPVTKPMMKNYVKNGVVPAPVNKRYYREHLCYALIMALFKNVYTVEDVVNLYRVQQKTYPLDVAYNFACTEFENALHEAFAFTGKPLPIVETKRTDQTVLVRSMVLSLANYVFVKHYLQNE